MLILVLAGSELPETAFICQLLNYEVETAASIALTGLIRPHCRTGSERISFPAIKEVDLFITDHAIDKSTLSLAESYAMTAMLGLAASLKKKNFLLWF